MSDLVMTLEFTSNHIRPGYTEGPWGLHAGMIHLSQIIGQGVLTLTNRPSNMRSCLVNLMARLEVNFL